MSNDRHWTVSWEIDAHESDPYQAACQAREQVQAPDSIATVYTVTDKGTGERWSVDLSDGTEQLLAPLAGHPETGAVQVTWAEGASRPCARTCGRDAAFWVSGTGACREHLTDVIGARLPQPQQVTVTKYTGAALCVVANGHDSTRAEYQAGRWPVCYRHLARGVAAAVRNYGRP